MMKFLKNIRIRTKLLISFGIVIIFSIILAVVGTITIINVANNYVYVQSLPTQQLNHLREIKVEFMTMRYRTSNYVMNGDDLDMINNVLIPLYNNAMASFSVHLDEYMRLNNENVMQDPQIKRKNEEDAIMLKKYLEDFNEFSKGVLELSLIGEAKAADSLLKEAIPLSGNIDDLIQGMTTPAEEFVADLIIRTNKSERFAIAFLVSLAAVLVIFAIILSCSIGNSISRSIVNLGKEAKAMSVGKLNPSLSSNSKDEIGELTRDLGVVNNTINKLLSAMGTMAKEQEDGDIDAKIDVSCFEGVYRTVAESVNNMLGDTIDQTIKFFDCMSEFGNGNFDANMPPQPGKKIFMNQTIDSIRDNLKSVSNDISLLIDAATQGNLSKRMNLDRYRGDWASLLCSLNKLMETIMVPIYDIEEVMKQVSMGNFSRKMEGNYFGDFLVIRNSVNSTVTNIASYIDEISDVLGALSQNDLNQLITREYVGKFSDIKNAINNIIDKFNVVISDISTAADQVAMGAKEVADGSMTLAQGSTEQASAIEELNDTVFTVNKSTAENAKNAEDAKILSNNSQKNAISGNRDMERMLSSMNGIKESSNNISNIIRAIEDIAFQTNLLALNAAVEAARAGVHGKGFAVVAEEVRNLAGRSQKASKETAALIEESINRINEGAQVAMATADAFRTIVNDASKVDDFISKIAQISSEQFNSISRITNGLSQISDVVQNNSATSEESASASQQLSGQAEVLRNLVKVFNLKER